MSELPRVTAGLDRRLSDTLAAIRLVFRRGDAVAVLGTITLGYLFAFLWAAGDLSYRPDMPRNFLVVDDPLLLILQRTGPASFEAIAILDTGLFRLLVSPMNIAIGLVIAVLVGISLGLTYLAVVKPKACGVGAGTGLFASLPALLSGTVCCGPMILLVLGIQASGVIMTAFFWLLPVGVLALIGSIVYLAGKIDISRATAV